MASKILVHRVRRSGDDSIAYLLGHGSDVRKVTFYFEPSLGAAVVTDGKDVPVVILLALPRMRREPERRLLFRFGVKKDDFTNMVLQPTFIRSLRLPAAQRRPHFKDSADFVLNRTGPTIEVINTIPLPAHGIARGKIKDVFCRPSIRVQVNSALNGCFRSICGFIECAEKGDSDCFEERSKVAAFCRASGTIDA